MEPDGPVSSAVEGRPDDFVQSVGRALRVLEVVGRHPGIPVKAIARQCALNISTSYHLVRTLAYEGYLVRLPDGTYVIGDMVARRFHDLLTSLDRPPAAAAVLRDLSARVGLTSYVGLLKDGRVTVVELAEAPGSPYLEDFEVGLDVAAHATALGKALLGAMSRRERHLFLLEQGLRPFTPRTRTDLGLLEEELCSLPAGAPVTEHGEFRDGISCTAAVVPRPLAADPAWAVVVAIRDDDVPARLSAEVALAAADLSGGCLGADRSGTRGATPVR